MPLEEAIDQVLHGEISDAKTVAGLLAYWRRLRSPTRTPCLAASEDVERPLDHRALRAKRVVLGRMRPSMAVDHQAAAAGAGHDAVAAVADVQHQAGTSLGPSSGRWSAVYVYWPACSTQYRLPSSQTDSQIGLSRARLRGERGSSNPKAKSALVGTLSSGSPDGVAGSVHSA